MEFEEFSGKTVDEALTEAAIKLQTTSDSLEVEIIDEGSKGVLGLGRKPARIRARKRAEENVLREEVVKEDVVKETASESNEVITETKVAGSIDVEKIAKEFLTDVFKAMKIDTEIKTEYDEKSRTLSIDLAGEEMGLLIGKRGQTIDSLQYLVSLVVNKETSDYVRVKVDTENYRERRKKTLEELAKNIAYKVKRTKKSVSLEPMNPYERRIIHSALQNDKYVTTRSEGEEPYRHIIVFLKK